MYKNLQTFINKYKLNKKRKRYKLLAIISIGLHIFGAVFVLYSLMFDIDSWTTYMEYTRSIIGLKEHKHLETVVLNVWMIAIQIRYVITDSIIFFNSLRNQQLLKYTIKIHGIESAICAVTFLCHNSEDCFIFGVICIGWSVMWGTSYLLVTY